jgi:rhomboid protease GluP
VTTRSPSEAETTLQIAWDDPLPASWALAAAIVVTHVTTGIHAVWLGRASWISALLLPRSANMRLLAGSQSERLVSSGEVWRAWTAAWLHADALHLLVNTLALVAIGRFLEPWIGRWRLWSWFWLSALGGAALTQAAAIRLSDGASAGAFGLLGAVVVLGWRWRDRLDDDDRWVTGRVLQAFLLLNLVLSFVLPFINAAGHVGGLVVGLLLGATWNGPTRLGRIGHPLFVIACLLVVLWGFVLRRL